MQFCILYSIVLDGNAQQGVIFVLERINAMHKKVARNKPEMANSAVLLAKMISSGYAEMHRLTTLIQEAEIHAIQVAKDGVVVYFDGVEKAIAVSAERREQLQNLFGELCTIRSASFWATIEEAWDYHETTHGKAVLSLWEKYCQELLPFVLQAIPENPEKKEAVA